uniref:Dimethylargininase n=1 Tax=Acrobeloides nanus TaxID=290746 RepID=A0A914E4R5_9BILA
MNPKENPVDRTLAMYQWNRLKLAIECAGSHVHVMEPHGGDHLPDMVFAADGAFIRGKKAYLGNSIFNERKDERNFYQAWLQKHGYETFGSLDFPFEGEGDARWVGQNQSKLVCGVGNRTDARVLDDLKQKLKSDDQDDFKVIPLKVVDPKFFGLDTCFCPLDDELALWYPNALDQDSQKRLKQEMELVPISESEALKLACDAVVIGKTVILNKGAAETEKTLKRLGYTPEFVDLSEFVKSGGSAKCLTLTLSL